MGNESWRETFGPILGAPRPKIGKIWKLDPFGRILVKKNESKFLAVERPKWVKNPGGKLSRPILGAPRPKIGKIWKLDTFGRTLVKKTESKLFAVGRPKWVKNPGGKLSRSLVSSSGAKYSLRGVGRELGNWPIWSLFGQKDRIEISGCRAAKLGNKSWRGRVLPDVRIYTYKYRFLTPYRINVWNFKKYGFFPDLVFVWIFNFFIFFLGNFLWLLRTSQFYSEWKVCGAIVSLQW